MICRSVSHRLDSVLSELLPNWLCDSRWWLIFILMCLPQSWEECLVFIRSEDELRCQTSLQLSLTLVLSDKISLYRRERCVFEGWKETLWLNVSGHLHSHTIIIIISFFWMGFIVLRLQNSQILSGLYSCFVCAQRLSWDRDGGRGGGFAAMLWHMGREERGGEGGGEREVESRDVVEG